MNQQQQTQQQEIQLPMDLSEMASQMQATLSSVSIDLAKMAASYKVAVQNAAEFQRQNAKLTAEAAAYKMVKTDKQEAEAEGIAPASLRVLQKGMVDTGQTNIPI